MKPRRPAEHAGEERERDRAIAGGCRRSTATDGGRHAPIRNWPCAPMLNRPALKPMPTARPARIERRRVDHGVSTIASSSAEGAVDEGQYAVIGRVRSKSRHERARRRHDQRPERRARAGWRAPGAGDADGAPRRARQASGRDLAVHERALRDVIAAPGCLDSSRSAGRHQQADLLAVGGAPVEHRDDPAAVHDADAVGQLEHLVELGGDEEDGDAGVAPAIAWRWMNSMLPTSRPRVGWSRTRSLRSPSNSRATTTFCWLPPDSVLARHVGGRRADVVLRRSPAPRAARIASSSRTQPARIGRRGSSR